MMKLLIVLAAVLASACAISFYDLVLEEWGTYKLTHGKTYGNDVEEKFRMKIFMENKHKIAKHNAKFARGEVSFKMGINKYADMLHHEFAHTVNGFNRSARLGMVRGVQERIGATFIRPANVEFPKSVDWRDKGAVTPVKDQGHCGSCWSFSATGSLEGQHFRKTGVLVSLSEQNLIDCSGKYGNQGCNGGMMDFAFAYVRDNKGIDTEQAYPYDGEDERCRFNPKKSGATDSGMVDVKPDEDHLKEAIATVGPVSVAIDASHESFQFYKEGVYYEPECSAEALDHGVLAVGYGTDQDGNDYWIVKNSWGPSWGQDGFIKMARNRDNHCGIATSASYPLV